MDKIETVLKQLVMQVSRLAFAVEEIAKNSHHASGQWNPCRCCGSTLISPGHSHTTCPACMTENAR